MRAEEPVRQQQRRSVRARSEVERAAADPDHGDRDRASARATEAEPHPRSGLDVGAARRAPRWPRPRRLRRRGQPTVDDEGPVHVGEELRVEGDEGGDGTAEACRPDRGVPEPRRARDPAARLIRATVGSSSALASR